MKKIIAAVAALALVASLSACGEKTEAPTSAPDESTVAQSDTQLTTDAAGIGSTDPSSEDASSATSETSESAETTEAAEEAPTTKADILALYNDATAKVVAKKVSFSKNRATGNEVYNAGVVLNAFKSTVYKFMGIGSENIYSREIAKGDEQYSRYIKASTLTEADISSAECTLGADGAYTVVIKVKGGSSSITDGGSFKNSAPIDKSGISAGENDKDYYDHKTAQNVFDAIDEIAGNATIKESYNNAKVTAVIDSEGNLTALTVTFDIAFDISQVYGSSGTATGTTTVKYTNFGW